MLELVLKEPYLSDVKIVVKCKKYPQFKKQLKQIEKAYNSDINMSLYSNLADVEKTGVFQFMQRDKLYISFYGFKMNNFTEQDFHRVYLLWISKMDEMIRKNLKMRYTIIYFHNMSNSIAPFLFIKDIFKKLPIQYYATNDKIYVVESSFLLRNAGLLEFGRLYRMYSQKLVWIENLKQLRGIQQICKNQIVEAIPEILTVELSIENKQARKTEDHKMMMQEGPPIPKIIEKKDCLTIPLSSHKLNQNNIPIYLAILVETMRKYKDMMKMQGIFRKAGSIEDEQEIIEEISKMNEVEMLRVPQTGVYSGFAIAGVIKKFFTKLEQPIVPYDVYNKIMAMTEIKQEEQVTLVRNIIQSLPTLNKNIILYVVRFIKYEVLTYEEQNKMNFYNMSVVFCPCFFRPEISSLQDLLNSGRFASILNIMFHNYEEIAGKEEKKEKDKRGSRGSRGSKDQSSSLKPLDTNL